MTSWDEMRPWQFQRLPPKRKRPQQSDLFALPEAEMTEPTHYRLPGQEPVPGQADLFLPDHTTMPGLVGAVWCMECGSECQPGRFGCRCCRERETT